MTDTATAMTRRTAAAVAPLLVLALAGAGCGFTESESPRAQGVPSHQASILEPGVVDVLTDATDPDALREVFEAVREERTDEDWWSVTIRCSSVAAIGSTDPRLATGRFANTQAGLAETGLSTEEDVDFATTGRTDCTPVDSTAPGAVTPDQVIDAVVAARLPAPNPQDASGRCAELLCLRRTTTDAFTVIVWPSSQAAAEWVEGFVLDAVRVGPVTTVHFQGGELVTPYETGEPDGRAAYVAALAPLGADPAA
jgi:hypothetical protein